MEYGFPGNPELGQLLSRVCNEWGVETLAHDRTTLAPEYGTLVPMRYMNQDQALQGDLGLGPVPGPLPERQRAPGWAMRRAVEDHYDGTVAFFASARCRTASRRTGWRRSTPSGSGARSSKRWTATWCACGKRRVEDLLRHAAGVRGQGPRRGFHARHGDAAGRAWAGRPTAAARKWSRLTSAPRHRADQRGLPVTPVADDAIPKAQASAAEGYTHTSQRL
jgi:3,4-dihydroxyphenylacetate 2,3-dioxygenase